MKRKHTKTDLTTYLNEAYYVLIYNETWPYFRPFK